LSHGSKLEMPGGVWVGILSYGTRPQRPHGVIAPALGVDLPALMAMLPDTEELEW
jgi:hypothetical protein